MMQMPSVPEGLQIDMEVINRLSLGDLEDFEELSGVPFGAILNGQGLTAKAIRAFLFVLERQDNPKLKFDMLRRVTLPELVERMGKFQVSSEEMMSEEPSSLPMDRDTSVSENL